jgi:hypothetical protein
VLFASVSQDFSVDPSELSLAAGTSEFALAWVAQADGLPALLMRRFDQVGQPLFVTFQVQSASQPAPSRPDLVRTDDGYAALWTQDEGDTPAVYFRRYVCAR